MLTRRGLFAWIGGILATVTVRPASALSKKGGRLWYRFPLPGGGGQWLPADGGEMNVPEISWHPDVPESERKGEPVLLYSAKSMMRSMREGGRGLRPQDRMNALVESLKEKGRRISPSHRETMLSPSNGFRAFFYDQEHGVLLNPERIAYLKDKQASEKGWSITTKRMETMNFFRGKRERKHHLPYTGWYSGLDHFGYRIGGKLS